MTLEELFGQISFNPEPVVVYFTMLPLLALSTGFIAGKNTLQKPYPIIFSGLVYAVTIPGLLAVIFIINDISSGYGWRKLDVWMQVVPVVSMILTYILISRFIPMKEVPGFKRLSGLLMVAGAATLILLLFSKTRIFVVFMGSFWHLLLLFAILFVVIKFGWDRMFKSSKPQEEYEE